MFGVELERVMANWWNRGLPTAGVEDEVGIWWGRGAADGMVDAKVKDEGAI